MEKAGELGIAVESEMVEVEERVDSAGEEEMILTFGWREWLRFPVVAFDGSDSGSRESEATRGEGNRIGFGPNPCDSAIPEGPPATLARAVDSSILSRRSLPFPRAFPSSFGIRSLRLTRLDYCNTTCPPAMLSDLMDDPYVCAAI